MIAVILSREFKTGSQKRCVFGCGKRAPSTMWILSGIYWGGEFGNLYEALELNNCLFV